MCQSKVIAIGFSDNCAILSARKLHQVKRAPPKYIEARNYKLFNSELFNEDLNRIPWNILLFETDPDDVWTCFKDLFLTAADKHVPIVTCRIRGESHPWLTNEIKDLIDQRDYHHKKSIKTDNIYHWNMYKRLRNAVTGKMRKEKSCYYVNELTESKDTKSMWKILNRILPTKKKNYDGNATNTHAFTMETFNQFFTSMAIQLCNFRVSLPRMLSPRVTENFSLSNVTVSYVYSELAKISPNKATGLDNIPSRLLKESAETIAEPLTYLINLILQTGIIPRVETNQGHPCAQIRKTR
jgi:hypothetical protein